MTVRVLVTRSLFSMTCVALAGLVACTPVVKEEVDQAEVVTYKLVESGTLEVKLRGQVVATETYSIEAGSDGNWVVTATQTPSQEGQNVRNVRMELDSTYKPIRYSEDAVGPSPMGIFISFLPDKTVFNIKKGDEPQISKTVEGEYDLYADPKLYHQQAILARAYLSRNTTEKVEFALLGGDKFIAKQEEPIMVETDQGPVEVLHLRFVLNHGKLREHVFVKADDHQLLKIEAGRGALQVYRSDIPYASELTSRKARKKKAEEEAKPQAAGETAESAGEPASSGAEKASSEAPAGQPAEEVQAQ